MVIATVFLSIIGMSAGFALALRLPAPASVALGLARHERVQPSLRACELLVDTTGWWDPATMTNDGTHPNDHGHQVLAGYLQPIVAAALDRCKGAHA